MRGEFQKSRMARSGKVQSGKMWRGAWWRVCMLHTSVCVRALHPCMCGAHRTKSNGACARVRMCTCYNTL